MQHSLSLMAVDARPMDDCWNRIGVHGDGSCPELTQYVHCRNCPVFARAGQQLFDHQPPESYVQQATQQLSQPIQIDSGAVLPVIVFRVGEEWLAFPVEAAVEITQAPAVHRIPHRHEKELLGLVNVRGELHLCISLQQLLGIDAAHTSAPAAGEKPSLRLLVSEYRGSSWAFQIDEVAGVTRVQTRDLSAPPVTVGRRADSLTGRVFVSDGRHIGMLDLDKLFGNLQRRIG
ncbi:chemotaxis protein CheW [Planctomicrobium piriforme]|uniref:Chemotaxis-related protein WspD n=1 Tax=Planctomicrobium piriforme TaxID=1576369 RepID=A0A1I3HS03_9PLAN|nr:chemotaxis protein CheW [Planctomicrobium piriforme]SFI38403.1 chemotaxis-related protein WspD [Planctomicrobium piriforme]